ncbi:MAG: isochorismate synthase [Candidatus Margulisbacteria bacterium]|nr:isochorismate synthase [Candidatus Margulisiibacteriota bacterium]
MAGIGISDRIKGFGSVPFDSIVKKIRDRIPEKFPYLRYFGGLGFKEAATVDSDWKAFGGYQFVLPQFQFYKEQGQNYFLCNILLDDQQAYQPQVEAVIETWKSIDHHPSTEHDALPSPILREDTPDFKRWKSIVDRALEGIEKKRYQKIVLARKTTFQFSNKVNPITLMALLKQVHQACFHFCFQPEKDVAFLGGSPERLFYRKGHLIKSEAIAGTRKRGSSPEEDDRLAKSLMESPKEIHEHHVVFNAIEKTLLELCDTLSQCERTNILKLQTVQHLLHEFEGKLHDQVTDGTILHALHPTPAVGGYPYHQALLDILKFEPFDRGWYTGPIGWVSSDSIDFVVAIRSGLLIDKTLNIYAGAGIVEGSSPQKEWEEVENKIRHMMGIITSKE